MVATVYPGKSYITGERGMELFTPKTAGAITPNHRLGGVVVNNIDARDSSNPAETEMRVNRALQAVHGSSVKTSLQAMQETRRRMPLGAT